MKARYVSTAVPIAPPETIMTGTVTPAGWQRNTAPARPSAVLTWSASSARRREEASAYEAEASLDLQRTLPATGLNGTDGLRRSL